MTLTGRLVEFIKLNHVSITKAIDEATFSPLQMSAVSVYIIVMFASVLGLKKLYNVRSVKKLPISTIGLNLALWLWKNGVEKCTSISPLLLPMIKFSQRWTTNENAFFLMIIFLNSLLNKFDSYGSNALSECEFNVLYFFRPIFKSALIYHRLRSEKKINPSEDRQVKEYEGIMVKKLIEDNPVQAISEKDLGPSEDQKNKDEKNKDKGDKDEKDKDEKSKDNKDKDKDKDKKDKKDKKDPNSVDKRKLAPLKAVHMELRKSAKESNIPPPSSIQSKGKPKYPKPLTLPTLPPILESDEPLVNPTQVVPTISETTNNSKDDALILVNTAAATVANPDKLLKSTNQSTAAFLQVDTNSPPVGTSNQTQPQPTNDAPLIPLSVVDVSPPPPPARATAVSSQNESVSSIDTGLQIFFGTGEFIPSPDDDIQKIISFISNAEFGNYIDTIKRIENAFKFRLNPNLVEIDNNN